MYCNIFSKNFLNSNFMIIIIYYNRYYNNYDTILTHNIYLNLKKKLTMVSYDHNILSTIYFK